MIFPNLVGPKKRSEKCGLLSIQVDRLQYGIDNSSSWTIVAPDDIHLERARSLGTVATINCPGIGNKRTTNILVTSKEAGFQDRNAMREARSLVASTACKGCEFFDKTPTEATQLLLDRNVAQMKLLEAQQKSSEIQSALHEITTDLNSRYNISAG